MLSVLGDLDLARFFCFEPLTDLQRLWLNLTMPLTYFAALGVAAATRRCLASRRATPGRGGYKAVNREGDHVEGPGHHAGVSVQEGLLMPATGTTAADDVDDDQLLELTSVVVARLDLQRAHADVNVDEADWAAESAQNTVVRWRTVTFLLLFGHETWTGPSSRSRCCIAFQSVGSRSSPITPPSSATAQSAAGCWWLPHSSSSWL